MLGACWEFALFASWIVAPSFLALLNQSSYQRCFNRCSCLKKPTLAPSVCSTMPKGLLPAKLATNGIEGRWSWHKTVSTWRVSLWSMCHCWKLTRCEHLQFLKERIRSIRPSGSIGRGCARWFLDSSLVQSRTWPWRLSVTMWHYQLSVEPLAAMFRVLRGCIIWIICIICGDPPVF